MLYDECPSVVFQGCVVRSKYNSITESMELVHTNPEYVHLKHANGCESAVLTSPCAHGCMRASIQGLLRRTAEIKELRVSADEYPRQLWRSACVRDPPHGGPMTHLFINDYSVLFSSDVLC